MNKKQFENMKKEIFLNFKMTDTTIKGIKDTLEYRENSAYNEGIRDTLEIINKYQNDIIQS